MPFHIALNMAGAVSAGAYTAGVLDFLIDAVDAWYAVREAQRAQHGDDIETWTIPAHEVLLEVMTGASAGGMCASISAVALKEEFDHVRQVNPPEQAAVNRLYQSWVRTIDITGLLGTLDLPHKEGPVHSILDSTPIEQIAKTALQPNPARLQLRPWVADQLGIILSLTNLRGVPYGVDTSNSGSFEERIEYHADQIQFAIAREGAAGTDTSLALNYSDPEDPNWGVLRTAAMATGAFPVMLASRVIQRKRADYENRLWNVANPAPDKNGQCQTGVTIPPAWDQTQVPAQFDNVYADGGVTDNNPFERARQYLAVAAGNAGGHNPREPENANAAVISVAPFPGQEPFDPGYDPNEQSQLLKVASALLGTLINQSRFQGEDLKLTMDPDVSSRFAIAPSDDTTRNLPALLCGSLGAFGGFIDEKFRDRDYQLGRRNCQQFLRQYFQVTEDNSTIGAGLRKKPEIADAFRREYGTETDGKWWYSIIPLMPPLREEIKVPPRSEFKTTPERLEQVADAAANRLKTVLHALASGPGQHSAWPFLIGAIFDLGGESKIKSLILDTLKTELGKLEQV